MKHLFHKLTSSILAVAMTAGLCVTASAAAPADYSVIVKDNKMSFVQYGKTVGTYTTRDGKITLSTDSDKDFLVCYYNTKNEYSGVSLGKQTSLTISGTMAALTAAQSLDDKIAVTVGTSSSVAALTVATPNPITIQGKVDSLFVTAAADVKIASGATVAATSVTSKQAKVTTEKGATVGKATATKPTTPATPAKPATPAASTSTSSTQVSLKTKAIYAEDGDRLSDLVDKLNDNVDATDKVTKDYVEGTAKWTSARSSALDSDGTFNFVFTPDDSSYDAVRGSIKIYIEGAAGEVTLTYKKNTISLGGKTDVKLKDLVDELNDSIYVTDDKGNDVEGKAKWNSSSSATADVTRNYSFTFTPRQSGRYEKVEGSIQIIA